MIKHNVAVLLVVVVFVLALTGLILTGVDTDSLCSPPRNIGLYRPIGLGKDTVFSRIVAYTEDVDPLSVLPPVQNIVSELFNGTTEYAYSSPRPSNMLWAWLRFLEHDLIRTQKNGSRDDYLLDRKNNSQQVNYASPYLDLSQIYGNSFNEAQSIRRDDGTGKLLTNYSLQAALLDNVEGDVPVFFLLDDRHNSNLYVDALYTLFVREHNYWCDRIFAQRPHLLGYDYYNIARHIVIAEMQSITYRTVLPLLVGSNININVACFSNKDDANTNYPVDHYVRKVSVYNEFASSILPAVYLSIQSDDYTDANSTLNDDYIWQYGIGALLANASTSRALHRDILIDGELLLNAAFEQLQVQRDHQIPPYQLYYNHYLHDAHVACQRFTYDRPLCNRVATTFSNEPVDLLTGALLERKVMSNVLLGNVAAHIVANQFTHLKRNDHYFYLWDDVVKPYLSEIHHVSLAKIILRNTAANINDLRPDVFEI